MLPSFFVILLSDLSYMSSSLCRAGTVAFHFVGRELLQRVADTGAALKKGQGGKELAQLHLATSGYKVRKAPTTAENGQGMAKKCIECELVRVRGRLGCVADFARRRLGHLTPPRSLPLYGTAGGVHAYQRGRDRGLPQGVWWARLPQQLRTPRALRQLPPAVHCRGYETIRCTLYMDREIGQERGIDGRVHGVSCVIFSLFLLRSPASHHPSFS